MSHRSESRDGAGRRARQAHAADHRHHAQAAGEDRRATLLDWGLDSLAAAGVARAVVNVHHLPQQIVAHVATRAYAADR